MKDLLLMVLSALLQLAGAIGRVEQQPLVNASPKTGSLLEVRHELVRAEIIPTVIHDFIPTFILSVQWGKAKANTTANLGNTLDPDDLQKAPRIALLDDPTSSLTSAPAQERSKGIHYTITLTDPDAPSRDNPEWSEMCHWVATDVHVSSSATSSLLTTSSSGKKEEEERKSHLKQVVPYKPPGPPPKTGKHRYVLLGFAPANSTTEPLHLTKPKERRHWGTGQERHGVRDWAEENGLMVVAANFVYAQNAEQ